MSPVRAIHVGPDVTTLDTMAYQLDRSLWPTPADAASGGLGGLVERMAGQFADEGVLCLDPEVARRLGMPADDEDAAAAELVAKTLAAVGWTTRKVGDWTTCHKEGRPTVFVADLGRMNPEDFPLGVGADPMSLVVRLKGWHDLMGYAWRLGPGESGVVVMARLDEKRATGKAPKTTWKPKEKPDGPAHEGTKVSEDDFRQGTWRRKSTAGLPWAHCFDKIRAYVSAAMITPVCPWTLKHTGKRDFDPSLAGWWQVEMEPWNMLDKMPHPAGYVILPEKDDVRDKVRWLTTPTVELLADLCEMGLHSGVRVVDSWTGPARDYPLRQYAETLRDAYRGARALPYPMLDQPDVDALESAVKMVGHRSFGRLAARDSWAFRPHMWHSVVAMNRANIWRLGWQIGTRTGHWPLWIETDAMWYASEHADPDRAAEGLQFVKKNGTTGGIVLDRTGLQLGRFTPKGVKKIRSSVKRGQ